MAWRCADGGASAWPGPTGAGPSPRCAKNQQWALDFLSDALASGRRIRALAVIDACPREALASEVDTSLPGERVVRVLERVAADRGLPDEVVLDNGPELTGRARDEWAHRRGVRRRFIDPGKPVQNALMESFNGRFRDECLNEHGFLGLADARRIIAAWRADDHHDRPHGSLGYRTPDEVRRSHDAAAAALPRTAGLSSFLDQPTGAGHCCSTPHRSRHWYPAFPETPLQFACPIARPP